MTEEIIVRIAARGDGVTASGRHVPMTAPGDTVDRDGQVTPGPHRILPPCRHYPACGGCQLQHLDDASYAAFVRDRIVSALAEHGITAPEMAAPHLSPPRTRRRASLRAERRGRLILLGFNEGMSHRIVDLQECHVLLPELTALLAPLRRVLHATMPDRGRAVVTLTRVDQGIDLLLAGFEVEGLAAVEALNDFAARQGLARLSVDEGLGPSARWCPALPTITLGGRPVGFPDGAFLQATLDGEAALVAAVIAAVGDAANVADLFAGLGTFALALGRPVHAVEGVRDSALALKAASSPVTVEHRDLFRRPLSAAELAGLDAVILDPPRAGAKEQIAELAKSGVTQIAYVSCNPATFARDARTLIDAGYGLRLITPVGQFRWSTHVELAAAFAR